jgi:hypothetical protein
METLIISLGFLTIFSIVVFMVYRYVMIGYSYYSALNAQREINKLEATLISRELE